VAIFQALFAAIGRYAGKFLNTAFGWATMLLFGKVPAKRQVYLSVATFASLAWLICTIGIFVPSVATFLLAFVPVPEWAEDWTRVVMIGLAVVLPLIVGVTSILMVDPADRPKGALGTVKGVLRGYPFALGLSLTMIAMVLCAPIIKVREIARRWESAHVPVVIEPRNYKRVVFELQETLIRTGHRADQHQATALLRWPTKMLTFFAGSSIGNFVADELTVLKAPTFEVLIHPSDILISGVAKETSRVHAILTERLPFSSAHLTWDKEAIALEDRLKTLWLDLTKQDGRADKREALARIASVEEMLHQVELPYEEWEVLYREKLEIERRVLRGDLEARGEIEGEKKRRAA
jgi:hypothetical protein